VATLHLKARPLGAGGPVSMPDQMGIPEMVGTLTGILLHVATVLSKQQV